MKRTKISTIISLLLAPFLLLIIKLLDLEYDSYSFLMLRLIPAIISLVFFIYFLYAYINNKNLILYFTKKFYHKELSELELEFLSHGDKYWVGVTFLNTIIQATMGIYADNNIWAFYSSIGWYIYLFFALIIQIAYGKIYFLKRVHND